MQVEHHTFLAFLLGLCFQHKIALATDSPYFDVTEDINKRNDTGIQNALNVTRTIYYSTDVLITEVLNLSWVPTLIMKNFPPEDQVEFCLMLSFQITKDKQDINWNCINNVFYYLPQVNSTENQESKQLISKHVCKIVLNFEADYNNDEYQLSENYASESSISFTKYTKKILKEIFGPEKVFPVGVLYTESQILFDKILLEQEIQHADFVIVSVPFTPMVKMPFVFQQFEDYMANMFAQNEQYLANVTTNGKMIPESSMIIWEKFLPSHTFSSEWERVGDQNILSSQNMYQESLHGFLISAVRHRKGNIEVISQTIFGLQEREIEEDYTSMRQIIPYLLVQESDINPCMMIRMLINIAQFGMESLAVNEFTWSAVVRYKEKLVDQEYSKETCGCSLDVEKRRPKNILLFVSKLTSTHWDQTGMALKNLVSENIDAAEMSLTAVIFSVNGFGMMLHSDINNVFGSIVRANNIKMGCQVDVTHHTFMDVSEGIIGHTERRCQPILYTARLIVWTIDVSKTHISAYNFSYDRFESDSLVMTYNLKKGLFRMLAVRDIYKRRRPDKEVMFSIITKELVSAGNCSECDLNDVLKEMDFRHSIALWGKIHKVRIIFGAAFDFKNKLNSLFEFPNQNENGSFDRCTFTF